MMRKLSRGRCGAPDPEITRALAAACRDTGADEVERLALFQAAIVASGLQSEPHAPADGRVGPLAQDAFWGLEPARRDPYVAATVFLKQARRLRAGARAPRTAATLAARVQHHGNAWRYLLARRTAQQVITELETAADTLPTPRQPLRRTPALA